MRRYAPAVCIAVFVGVLLILRIPGGESGTSFAGRGDYRVEVLRTERKNDQLYLIGGKVLVTSSDGDIRPQAGDVLLVRGRAEKVSEIRSRGYADYLRSRGILYRIRAEKIERLATEKNLHYYIGQVREVLGQRIESIFRQESPLIKALLYGDREEVPQEMLEVFARTGTSHIISISGFHIGLIAGAALVLMKRLPAKLRYALALGLIAFFVLLTGARPSAVRAGVFYLLILAGILLGREYDLISAACMTASFFIALNPYIVYDRGFSLSFLAVLSIGMFRPLLTKYFRKIFGGRLVGKAAVQALILTLSAQILTFPISYYYFGRVPLLAAVANILSLPLISLLYPLLFGTMAVFELPLIGEGMRTLALADLRLFLRINEEISALSWSCIRFSEPSPVVAAGMYIVIFAGYQVLLRRELKENANAAWGFEEAC